MLINWLKAIVLILAFFSFSVNPPSVVGVASTNQPGSLYNPMVQLMLDQVDQGEIYSLTGDLSGEWTVTINEQPYTLKTRHALSGEPNQKAAEYLYQYYQALGLDTSYQNFTYQEQLLSNVVAQKTGTVFPERVFMITSHFDDVPITPPAPGADDNASGTVAVMLAASILNQYEFGCTLRFVNFNAEEYGLIGSEDYTQQAYCAGEDIRGVLNLDMIAWNTTDSAPEMDLHALSSIPGSSEMADVFQEVVSAYGLQISPTTADPITTRSDHSSFWRRGYPAILVTEDMDDFNPNYHSADDLLENIQDFNYYAEMIKASLGTLAHLGCLVEDGWGTVSGIVTDQTTQLPIPGAAVSLTNPEWGYTFNTRTDQSGNYKFSALQGWHTLTADDFGYRVDSTEIYVTQNQSLTVNLELMPANETATYLPLAGSGLPIPQLGCP
jgi:hypothetical protein